MPRKHALKHLCGIACTSKPHNEIVSISLMALLSPRAVRKEGEMLTLVDFKLCARSDCPKGLNSSLNQDGLGPSKFPSGLHSWNYITKSC
jgi:hypothetical protein